MLAQALITALLILTSLWICWKLFVRKYFFDKEQVVLDEMQQLRQTETVLSVKRNQLKCLDATANVMQEIRGVDEQLDAVRKSIRDLQEKGAEDD